jgi:hypothetical protein
VIVFSRERFKTAIADSGKRVEQISVESGVSYTHIKAIGRGHANPGRRALEKVGAAIGWDPADFYVDDGKTRAIPFPPGAPPPPPLTPERREKLRALLDMSGTSA